MQEPIRPLFDKLKRPPGDYKTYPTMFLGCILEISDFVERYLFAHGVTEDIMEKNKTR